MNLTGADMQMQEMRDRLATATQRAEAAESKLNDTLPQYVAQMATLLERAEAAEAALAAAPVGAMKLVVWMLDGGPWDDVAFAKVQRWIDAREEAQP